MAVVTAKRRRRYDEGFRDGGDLSTVTAVTIKDVIVTTATAQNLTVTAVTVKKCILVTHFFYTLYTLDSEKVEAAIIGHLFVCTLSAKITHSPQMQV